VLVDIGLIAAVLLVSGLILYRQSRRMGAIESERARLERILGERNAALGAAPTARYLFPNSGDESFMPGTLSALGGPEQDFPAILTRFARNDAAALATVLAKLRQEGAAFELTVSLASGGLSLDVSGRRLVAPDGNALGEAVWFTDADARARAERERDSLRAMVDALPIPLWRRRASDLVVVDCNRAYAVAVDVPPEKAVAEGRELAGAAGGKALAARAREISAMAVETRHVVIGGSRRLLELAEIPLRAVGEFSGGELCGFARDLTDLEAAQAELQRHIAAHATVLERIAVAIAIYGPDRRLAFFNTAFAQLWHLEEDWLSTHPLVDEVMDRLRERRRLPEVADFRAFRRQLLGQFTSLIAPHEELQHLPDERTLRLIVSPHPFGGLTFAYEDVTDRLALERSYNTLIQVQRETLDHLYEGIAVFGSDGRLKLWNPAYAKLWNLVPETLAGEPHVAEITEKLRSFFEESKDWPALKARIIARLTADTPANTRLERRDGSVLQAVTVPLPDGNILLSYLDTTDSIRVENALRERNEALETAGRLKSEFIANVSYELRTPLNAIIGFTEILANQYFGELNPRQADYAQSILESSGQLLSLINDILDLATIEAGYMEIDREPVDVLALMSGVMTFARERARAQGLRLEFDCPSDIGTVPGDERRLKQAVFNLVSNALKFTPEGGAVTLAARREGERVALVVSDTGVGVAQEDQQRIFDKFERGNSQARQSGAGLGLSLVKSLIELHGGSVELQSRPGHGTVVTCWLNAVAPVREVTRLLA
jgi:signal transduction histidine kinase